MKTKLYSVEDVKSGRFNPPFASQTDVDACRAFQRNCENTETLWNKYPEDFRLVHIGFFDDEQPMASQWAFPTVIASAMNYVQKKVSREDLITAAQVAE